MLLSLKTIFSATCDLRKSMDSVNWSTPFLSSSVGNRNIFSWTHEIRHSKASEPLDTYELCPSTQWGALIGLY